MRIIGPGDETQERAIDISDMKTRAALAVLLEGTPKALELIPDEPAASRISCE